ncbi:MAG: glycine cleavage system aminomethyltransferase GcvT, partial [Firmicutes bacterium]|nr:glycine cleavage system aminomethyltransferase GcvT [Bacillota bacterium]
DLKEIDYYWFRPRVDIKGIRVLVSRTGYTGEDGFEIYCAPDDASFLWEALMEGGEDQGLLPAGLGARDTLRFEARMPLYGHELDENTSPLEAGLGSFVSFGKGDFVGRVALLAQREQGLKRKLVGFEMVGRGVPRAHYPILQAGQEVGYVSTGSFSPTLEKNIGLGFVPPAWARVGTELEIGIRGKGVKAIVVKTPFYRRP